MKEILINLNIKTDADTQALLGLYAGILGSIKLYEAQGSTIMLDLCSQLEENFKKMFLPNEWAAIKAELTDSSQKAASFAENNQKGLFDGFEIKP